MSRLSPARRSQLLRSNASCVLYPLDDIHVILLGSNMYSARPRRYIQPEVEADAASEVVLSRHLLVRPLHSAHLLRHHYHHHHRHHSALPDHRRPVTL